jgi:hypothetical protein
LDHGDAHATDDRVKTEKTPGIGRSTQVCRKRRTERLAGRGPPANAEPTLVQHSPGKVISRMEITGKGRCGHV